MAFLYAWNGSTVATVTSTPPDGAVGCWLLPQPNASPRSVSQLRCTGPEGAGDQVQQPAPGAAVLIWGQVHDPGQFLRAASAVLERLGRHIAPHVLVHSEGGHPSKRVGSAAAAARNGSIEVPTVRQVVPS